MTARIIGVCGASALLRARLAGAAEQLSDLIEVIPFEVGAAVPEGCAVGVVAREAGESAVATLAETHPHTRWVLAAKGDVAALRAQASAAGAQGLCDPEAGIDAWAEVLGRVLAGASAWPEGSDAPAPVLAERLGVTHRQLEVLDLVSRGLTNGEIGGALGIATATAKAHVAAVIAALEVSNRLEAAVAYRDVAAEQAGISRPAAGDRAPRVGVLVFADRSPDRDHAFFADGIAEEIIGALSRVPGLRVAARTSSFAFRDQNLPATQIAAELGVDLLVEGSVRRHGNAVRVAASLVSGADGFPLWSETYSRELRDVFDVQDDIARAVVTALRLEIAADEPTVAVAEHSSDTEACDLYWRARYFWNRRTPQDVLRAVQYFQGAIDRDEGYALAHVGLADAYNQIGSFATIRPADVFPKARVAAARALELAPALGEAHAALGYVTLVHDYALERAEACFERAIECNPSYAFVHGWLALPSAFRHRFDLAIEQSRRGQALDPLSVHFAVHLGHMHYLAGRLDEAVLLLEGALEMDEQNPRGWSWLALVHAAAGRFDEGIRCFERGRDLSGGHPLIGLGLANVLARAGRESEARALDEVYAKRATDEYVSPVYRSYVPIGLGDFDAAFAYLEQAFEDRAPILMYLGVEPLFEPIRSDPRYAQLVDRVGVPR